MGVEGKKPSRRRREGDELGGRDERARERRGEGICRTNVKLLPARL